MIGGIPCQRRECSPYYPEERCDKESLIRLTGAEQQSERAEGSLFSISAITSHLLELGYPESSLRSMLKCGNSTTNFIIAQCDCDARVIPLKHRCNLRTCSYCSKTRKRRIRRKYLNYLKKIPQNRKNFLYFLTISPKNYKNLSEGIEHIKKSFSKFLRHRYLKERIRGGLYVIEAKGTEGNWNIHIHSIIYGQFLDNRVRGKCLDCGQNLMKYDYNNKKYYCASKNCNSLNVLVKEDSKLVRLFKQSSKRACNVHISKQGTASFTLNYMLKYISTNKDDFSTPKDVANYIFSTKKKRLINTFGHFYKAKMEKSPPICPKCESQIYFIFDIEVNNILNQEKNRPPDLYSYCEA